MALLTEEQVEDVMAMFDCYASGRYKKSFEYDFGEWNEKQQPAAFEPDWSKAPKSAVMAAINISWLTENGSWTLGYRLATYDRPPVTPHPHAEMMMKYAEVAARRVDPWLEFEFRCLSDNWSKCSEFLRFYDDYEYRHIGEGNQ